MSAGLIASIPRLTTDTHRPQYTFAITAKDPPSIDLKAPGQIKLTSRIKAADGYIGMSAKSSSSLTIGNIALQVEVRDGSVKGLAPVKGEIWTFPTHKQLQEPNATAKMFFEIHPQLWGNVGTHLGTS
jgi:hypothetical protein